MAGRDILWPTLMALMLGYAVSSWRDRRYRRTWVAMLVLMGTCPVWFVVVYAIIFEFIKFTLGP